MVQVWRFNDSEIQALSPPRVPPQGPGAGSSGVRPWLGYHPGSWPATCLPQKGPKRFPSPLISSYSAVSAALACDGKLRSASGQCEAPAGFLQELPVHVWSRALSALTWLCCPLLSSTSTGSTPSRHGWAEPPITRAAH